MRHKQIINRLVKLQNTWPKRRELLRIEIVNSNGGPSRFVYSDQHRTLSREEYDKLSGDAV